MLTSTWYLKPLRVRIASKEEFILFVQLVVCLKLLSLNGYFILYQNERVGSIHQRIIIPMKYHSPEYLKLLYCHNTELMSQSYSVTILQWE